MKPTLTLHAALLALLASPATGQFTDGHIFVTDYSTNQVFEIDPTDWSYQAFAGPGDGISGPSGLGFTADHKLLVSNFISSTVIEFDVAGNGRVVLDANDGLNGPWGENGIAIDSKDQVYVSNFTGQRILRFDENYGNMTVFADSADGVAKPDGLNFTADGDLLVANRFGGGQVLRIDPAGNTVVWDTIPNEEAYTVVVRNTGDVYVGCGSGNVFRYLLGDPNQRTLFGTWGFSNVGLAFSPDFSVLYHSNAWDGQVQAIDPVTGTSTVVVDAGWQAIGITVAGSQYPPGSFAELGRGVAGAGGQVPVLRGQGEARLGATVTLETRDFVGGARSYFLVSSDRSDLATLGGTLYPSLLAPHWIWVSTLPGAAGVPGDGDEDRIYSIPTDPLLNLTNWYFQQLAADPVAPRGITMTNGLRMYIGQ